MSEIIIVVGFVCFWGRGDGCDGQMTVHERVL